MADTLAKEAARRDGTNYGYSRIPISAIYREGAEEALQKMARTMDKNIQGRDNKTVFPNSHGQNRDNN